MRKNNEIIKYEYKTVTVSKNLENKLKNIYLSNGWSIVESNPINKKIIESALSSIALLFGTSPEVYFDDIEKYRNLEDKVEFKFKRKCKLKNNADCM